jgi:hypothetical protein
VGVTDGRGRRLYSDDIHLHEISRTVRTHIRYPVSGSITRPSDILYTKQTFVNCSWNIAREFVSKCVEGSASFVLIVQCRSHFI